VHNPHQELGSLLPSNDRTPLHCACGADGTADVVMELLAADVMDAAAQMLQQDCLGRTPMHVAAESGNCSVVEAMLQRHTFAGYDATSTALFREVLQMRDGRGRTVLHAAARGGSLDVLRALLKQAKVCLKGPAATTGPDFARRLVQQLDRDNRSPHWLAAAMGHLAIAKELCKDPATANYTSADPEVAADDATKLRMTDPTSGRTPLQIAALQGRTPMVKWILDVTLRRGEHINYSTWTEPTPLYLAAQSGHLQVVRVLMDRMDIPVVMLDGGGSEVQVERNTRTWATVQWLLGEADFQGRTALHHAAWGGHKKCLRQFHERLLPLATDTNIKEMLARLPLRRGGDGTSVFMAAVGSGVPAAVEEVLSWRCNRSEDGQWVLDEGMQEELARETSEGWTVWHFAGRAAATGSELAMHVDSLAVLEMLLQLASQYPRVLGALPGQVWEQCTVGWGLTPIMIAAVYGQQEVVEWWVDNGCKVDRKDVLGRTALHEAAWRGDLAAMRVILARVKELAHSQGAVQEAAASEAVACRSFDGTSVLMAGVASGSAKMVQLLLDNFTDTAALQSELGGGQDDGTSVARQNQDGWTVWHFAGRAARQVPWSLHHDGNAVNLLLTGAQEVEADIKNSLRAQTHNGCTPIMVAASHGQHKVIGCQAPHHAAFLLTDLPQVIRAWDPCPVVATTLGVI
jgi:ankyrin repeat protein